MEQSSDVDVNIQSTDTQDEKDPLIRNENLNNRGGASAVIIILILTFFQYVAYFSVVKNMVGYWHEDLKSSMKDSWLERMLLVGGSQCAALFGGIIADVLLGKRKTLGVGFTLYFLGAMMLEISTADSQKTSKKSLATASVVFIVLAEACVSPTLAILGATQLSVSEHNCELVMLMFYLFRNCGALLVNYLVTFVFGPAGDGQFWPALAATLAALLLYLIGLRRYKVEKKIEGLTTCGDVWILIKSWRQSLKDRQKYVTDPRRQRKEGAVTSFKRLVTLILVNSSVFSFSIIYSQMLTTYSLQATLLRSPSNILVSSTFLTSFNDITVIVLTVVVLVLFKSKLRWRKLKVDLFSRMGIGVACAVLSAFLAIMMETARKADFRAHGDNASLSVFILLPQYALVGAGEIMTLVSGMQMAFLGAPRGLRCTALGLFWTATGLGYFAAFGVLAFVITCKPDWISFDEVQQLKHLGQADYHLLLLMALLTICFIFFLLTARYVNKTMRKRSFDANARKKLERVSIQEPSSSQNPPGNSSGTNLCQKQENDETDGNVESSYSSVKPEIDGETATKTLSSDMPASDPSC